MIFLCLLLYIYLALLESFQSRDSLSYFTKYFNLDILSKFVSNVCPQAINMNPKRSHAEIGLSQANRLDRVQSNHLQKIYQLQYDSAKDQNKLRKYKKIKYQGLIYKIGEFIEIYHLGAIIHYVAKLVNIASIIHDEKSEQYATTKIDFNCPMIEVEWYMKKSDLSRDPKYQKDWKNTISDYEVFASGKTFALPVEAIVGKCEVLTIKEYWLLQMIDTQIYFSRASYNIDTETLKPSIEEWEPKYCVCQKPYNPDLEWVECELCNKWFHGDCVIRDKMGIENFACEVCTKKEALNKKKKKSTK